MDICVKNFFIFLSYLEKNKKKVINCVLDYILC
jgi:hypothetical protein